MTREQIKTLERFAASVGGYIAKEDGMYCLFDRPRRGRKRLCVLSETLYGAEDDITAYFGSHPDFRQAREEYDLEIGVLV